MGTTKYAQVLSAALGPRRLHTVAPKQRFRRKVQAMSALPFTFVAGVSGTWQVVSSSAVCGAGLPLAARLEIHSGLTTELPGGASWLLRGVTSNERYVTRAEKSQLVAKQAGLGRAEAQRAALIPIQKSAEWWAMTQDERRSIFEARSKHIEIGLRYLPAIARRLHHARDLGEPFDFVTWFDYAREDAPAFEDLVGLLRATEEWQYVVREVDVRLER